MKYWQNLKMLEPPAPIRTILDLDSLLSALILFHNDLEMQFRDVPESTFAIKLYPLLLTL